MVWQRKKIWRKFYKYKKTDSNLVLRHILIAILTLELTYGGVCLLKPVQLESVGEYSWQVYWNGMDEKTFGIQLDLENASLNFYKRETHSQQFDKER